MNRSVLIYVLVLLALLLGVGLLALRNRYSASASEEVAGVSSPAAEVQSTPAGTPAALRPPPRHRPNLEARGSSSLLQSTGPVPGEYIEGYLTRFHRRPENLLAAFSASQEKGYLREAANKDPQNPRVQLAMVLNQVTPEEQRVWLDRLKQSDPDNSLGYYLSALDYLRQKDFGAAIRDLTEGNSKGQFNAYRVEEMKGLEELSLSVGRAATDAKLASVGVSTGLLSQSKALAEEMGELMAECRQKGDATSAEAIARMGLGFAQRLNRDGPGTLVLDQLVGIAMEQRVLAALDPAGTYAFLGGKSVAERVAELRQQQQDLSDQSQAVKAQFADGANEAAMVEYLDRVQAGGEAAAMRSQRRP